MKQVWKCDYCSHTDIDKDDVKQHENDCSFNENNKNCYTCDHRGGWDVCFHKNEHCIDDFLEVNNSCVDWYNEEYLKLREKKLERITNEPKCKTGVVNL